MDFVVKKTVGELERKEVSELDRARMDYEELEPIDIADIYEDGEMYEFSGMRLSDIMEFEYDNDKVTKAFLNIYNDELEERLTIQFRFPFKKDVVTIGRRNKLYPLIYALTGDGETDYFDIDWGKLQETLDKVKYGKVGAEEVDDGNFNYYRFIFSDIEIGE